MPELGEVAHAASLLRQFLLGRTIKSVEAIVDEKLFVAPLTNVVFQNELTGATVTDVNRNGKYFWFEINKRKTVLLHFGMTGWIHVKDVYTHFIAMENAGDVKQKKFIEEMKSRNEDMPKGPVITEKKSEVWPPKFVKFSFDLDNGKTLAFTDPRRLGKVRLLDVPSSEVQSLEPVSKLGRDYSQDPLGLDEFSKAVSRRKVPTKALLLDQAVFSGIGNWMADEILFHAEIHPEQVSSTLSEEQLKLLYDSLLEVCKVSVATEGNTAAFPSNWLMLHRWGKRKKNERQYTAEGHEIDYITVGGRTSCYVPSRQKLTSSPDTQGTKSAKPKQPAKRKAKVKDKINDGSSEQTDKKTPSASAAPTKQEISSEQDNANHDGQAEGAAKSRKRKAPAKQKIKLEADVKGEPLVEPTRNKRAKSAKLK